ncbi:hypothetical protein [Bosea sp. Tri-44]|uniref:hypothetical protein n=1 Tax=Bosea sp. Tri-44 TaxID=1972137 RepID=UPI00100DA12D|nr:hypothetical protein [Bosea sp. Tri-44]
MHQLGGLLRRDRFHTRARKLLEHERYGLDGGVLGGCDRKGGQRQGFVPTGKDNLNGRLVKRSRQSLDKLFGSFFGGVIRQMTNVCHFNATQ